MCNVARSVNAAGRRIADTDSGTQSAPPDRRRLARLRAGVGRAHGRPDDAIDLGEGGLNARGLLGLAALVALVGVVVLAWQRFEGTPPSVTAPEALVLGTDPVTLDVAIADADSGLRVASVRMIAASGSRNLYEDTWPGSLIGGGAPGSHAQSVTLTLDPATLKVSDGAATVVVDARDWSWRDAFAGNRSEVSIPVTVDTRPPEIRVESGLTYVHRGGSAAAVYRLGEETVRDGVRVGDAFFPGHPHPNGDALHRVALFSVPVEAPKGAAVQVVAVDRAGNEGSVRFPAEVLERVFRKSRLPLSEDFISRVAEPLASEAGLPTEDPAATFQGVNETLRARNEATIRERVAGSDVEKRWSGAFQQLAGSQVMSRFAEHRTYVYGGRPISTARHYGFDLASTARAPITAAGAGRVVAAEPLGIYGNCIVIDHGLGLASLYGHLSTLDVAVGDDVERGQRIGLSGDTGLAGGDHLHFAFLIGDSYVDPLEWWDPKWVRSHVEVRLEPSSR
jgi:murein DD-endopeptidase MepM/ murein hydrolase activator NlpD